MIKVIYRDKVWEVPGRQTMREVILAVGLNPATMLAVRRGKLVLDSEVLDEDDEVKLIAIISGGSPGADLTPAVFENKGQFI